MEKVFSILLLTVFIICVIQLIVAIVLRIEMYREENSSELENVFVSDRISDLSTPMIISQYRPRANRERLKGNIFEFYAHETTPEELGIKRLSRINNRQNDFYKYQEPNFDYDNLIQIQDMKEIDIPVFFPQKYNYAIDPFYENDKKKRNRINQQSEPYKSILN
jgi:hypothetical protein